MIVHVFAYRFKRTYTFSIVEQVRQVTGMHICLTTRIGASDHVRLNYLRIGQH